MYFQTMLSSDMMLVVLVLLLLPPYDIQAQQATSIAAINRLVLFFCFLFITFHVYCLVVPTIFNEEAYLTCESIFHKALNSFKFECETTFESVPWTNQYLVMRVKFLAQGNNGCLWWGSNTRPPHLESDVQPTAPRCYMWINTSSCGVR